MNKRDIRESSGITRVVCSTCNTAKYSVVTINNTGCSMLQKLQLTSHCCDNPMYWWKRQ